MSETARLFTDGEAYEQVMGRWSRMVGKTFLDWLEVPAGMRWADIGCGNGAFTDLIVARCAPSRVFGFDPSPGQIAYARTRPGAQQAQYQVAGAEALPLADDSADVAVMALVISFMSDPAKAIAEMARAVRPGGWVATTCGISTATVYRHSTFMRRRSHSASRRGACRTRWWRDRR